MHQIPKLKWFSSRLAFVFTQSIEAGVLSREWRCSWSSAHRRCSNYIWVINDLIAYKGASYIRDLTVHYSGIIMGVMASQITSLTIVYSTIYSGADQRKHQSSASMVFVWGIHWWPVNFPHKWPVTWKMFPSDDIIMICITHVLTVQSGTSIYPQISTLYTLTCFEENQKYIWISHFLSMRSHMQLKYFSMHDQAVVFPT